MSHQAATQDIDSNPLKEGLSSQSRSFQGWMQEKWPYLFLTFLMVLLLILVLWHRIVIWIEAGEAGVLYRPLFGGTVTEQVYTEGIHILWPFNTMTIYNTRVQITRHELNVLTNRGLPVALYLAVRYRPIFELLGILHQKVGPDYPNKIIIPQIESVLRKGLGTHSPEEIYTNKDMLLSKLITAAIEEVGQKFVIVDDIIIRSIELPESVRKSIEEKLIEEQRYLTYSFRLQREKEEAERKRIESAGIRDYSKTLSEAMNKNVLQWRGIEATEALARSQNAKIIVIGSGGQGGLPLILNTGNESDSSGKGESSGKQDK